MKNIAVTIIKEDGFENISLPFNLVETLVKELRANGVTPITMETRTIHAHGLLNCSCNGFF